MCLFYSSLISATSVCTPQSTSVPIFHPTIATTHTKSVTQLATTIPDQPGTDHSITNTLSEPQPIPSLRGSQSGITVAVILVIVAAVIVTTIIVSILVGLGVYKGGNKTAPTSTDQQSEGQNESSSSNYGMFCLDK